MLRKLDFWLSMLIKVKMLVDVDVHSYMLLIRPRRFLVTVLGCVMIDKANKSIFGFDKTKEKEIEYSYLISFPVAVLHIYSFTKPFDSNAPMILAGVSFHELILESCKSNR